MHRVALIAAAALLPLVVPLAHAQDIACMAPAPASAPEVSPWPDTLRDFATGAGVRVAVIDTGVSPHPELDQLIATADFVSPEQPDPLFDCDGHGTVVAGIIAANSTGIAPDAEILAVRQTSAHYRNRRSDEEVETSGSLRSLADAIHAALDDHARVINISVVSCVDPRDADLIDASTLHHALARAEHDGAVVVSAAGNVTTSCPQGSFVFPSHLPTVLSVGARADAHTLADYSVDFPEGLQTVSAAGTHEVGLSWNGGFARGSAPERDTVHPFTGTSFAAPVVSGTAALLLQRHPHLTPDKVRWIIRQAAQPAHGAVDPLAVVTHLPSEDATRTSRVVLQPSAQETSGAGERLRAVLPLLAAAAVCAWAVGVMSKRCTRPRDQ
ncbi:S8 family serine peptidase [Corynebacterium mayonis]|uniref:S8 family serine peptidase n=1 Tax=Corynebacterium mayonis TaxID=3062461 RepID=UPI003140C8CD